MRDIDPCLAQAPFALQEEFHGNANRKQADKGVAAGQGYGAPQEEKRAEEFFLCLVKAHRFLGNRSDN